MGVILEDRPTITIEPPTNEALRTLWDLAIAKFEARVGAPPKTREDWRAVTADYNALTSKQRGSLERIVRERCERAPGGD